MTENPEPLGTPGNPFPPADPDNWGEPLPEENPAPVLGRVVQGARKQLDVFPNPGVDIVVMECDEFTSLCPVTKQPDMGIVRIEYSPGEWCLESKSLKLYLWTFREQGVFCEALAYQIANELSSVLKPKAIQVTVQQKPRGGIGVRAMAALTAPPPSPMMVPKGGDIQRLLGRKRH